MAILTISSVTAHLPIYNYLNVPLATLNPAVVSPSTSSFYRTSPTNLTFEVRSDAAGFTADTVSGALTGGNVDSFGLVPGVGSLFHQWQATGLTLTLAEFNTALAATTALNFWSTLLADADTVYGSTSNDTLYGFAENDSLFGGRGIDSLIGGTGSDTLVVDDTRDRVTELLNEGSDWLEWQVANGQRVNLGSYANVENFAITGAGRATSVTGTAVANILDGGAVAGVSLYGALGGDTLIGGANNQFLDGGLDADYMAGGGGNDTYIVDNVGDVVVESGSGSDTIRVSLANYAFVDRVENYIYTGRTPWIFNGADTVSGGGVTTSNLTAVGGGGADSIVGGNGADSLFGNGGNDTIIGNSGADTLNGGAGVDSLIGGEGNDTYIFDNAGDTLSETGTTTGDRLLTAFNTDLTLAGFTGIEHVTLTANARASVIGNDANNRLIGSTGANSLIGGAGNDTLIGDAGNDTLSGGIGVDEMEGGLGNDLYYVDDDRDEINGETLNGGIDTVVSSVDFDLDIIRNADDFLEHLTLVGADTLRLDGDGNQLNNRIIGHNGINELNGDLGNDTLMGFGGADTLNGGGGLDSLAGGDGNDTYILQSDLLDRISELALVSSGTADLIIGRVEGTDLTYTMRNAANVENFDLEEGQRITVLGNASNNIIRATDTGATFARVFGDAGADTIIGSTGAETLDGGAGDDVIVASNGEDTLFGGAGNDIFDFNNATGGIDSIRDFVRGQDRIDLRDLLSGITPTTAGYIGDGIIRLTNSGGHTFVEFDATGRGDGESFVAIAFVQNVLLEAGDLILP